MIFFDKTIFRQNLESLVLQKKSNLGRFIAVLQQHKLNQDWDELAQYALKVEVRTTTAKTRDNLPLLLVEGRSLHSRYSPEKEAQNIYSQHSHHSGFILLQGGLNYLTTCLVQHKKIVFILEYDFPLFLYGLGLRDITHLGSSSDIHFLWEPSIDLVISLLQQNFIDNPAIILNLAYQNNDSMRHIFQQLQDSRKMLIVNQNTHKEFQHLWFQHILKNIDPLSNFSAMGLWQGRMKNYPALILAAGPSLTEAIPHLPALREKYIFIAVDTAYALLKKNDISVDFIVSVDAQFWNRKHLDTWKGEGILLSNFTLSPSLLRRQHTLALMANTGFPVENYLCHPSWKNYPIPRAGGSVATAAYSYAKLLGFSSITFIGMDLGFPQNQTHAKGSFFEERSHWIQSRFHSIEKQSWEYLHNGNTHYVYNNLGEHLLSDWRMDNYVHWFEEQFFLKNEKMKISTTAKHARVVKGLAYEDIHNLHQTPDCRVNWNTDLKKWLAIINLEETHVIHDVNSKKKNLCEQMRVFHAYVFETLNLLKNASENDTTFKRKIQMSDEWVRASSCGEILGNLIDPYLEEALSTPGLPSSPWHNTIIFYELLAKTSQNVINWLNNNLGYSQLSDNDKKQSKT